MFKNRKTEITDKELKAGSINIVGLGTEIKGNLNTKGDVRIDGKIEGNIISKAKVVIGSTGEVIGNINSESAEINGKVNGNICTAEILFLKATSSLIGDISSNKLVVENGANLTGQCQTGISQTKSIHKPIFNGPEAIGKREATA
ncbi:polymer-forming cytoskeletal protein [Pedobacter sp. SD-b]|uniref:Polymer-forming cytoskeletal protein n=1 Tax=Pedobacter segetis TaxID=2793069 RepID=A0ABS1BIN3_9SPHI|nr:polymer-forming cytoskeletal protein [Pedobacter segetis]MBK0382743.1 polymer-forming cytoskeletal protein [Pedobacter segetis]